MQRQQIMFGMGSGVSLSVLGSLLAVNGIADWSLFAVGLGLMSIALTYAVRARTATGQNKADLVPIQLNDA